MGMDCRMVYQFGQALARTRSLTCLHLSGNIDSVSSDRLVVRALCDRAKVKPQEREPKIDFNLVLGDDGTTVKA
jgi:hypothetical protein